MIRNTRTTSPITRNLITGALLGVAAPLALVSTSASALTPAPVLDLGLVSEAVCPHQGKVDVAGEHHSLELFAPEGKLIAGYCVKAGSAQQGNGPETTMLDVPLTHVVISHTSGKAISHYTLFLVDAPVPELPWADPGIHPDPTPEPDPNDFPITDVDPVEPDPEFPIKDNDPVEPEPEFPIKDNDPIDPEPNDFPLTDNDPVDPDPEIDEEVHPELPEDPGGEPNGDDGEEPQDEDQVPVPLDERLPTTGTSTTALLAGLAAALTALGATTFGVSRRRTTA